MPSHISQILHSSDIERKSLHSLTDILTIGSKLPQKILQRFKNLLSKTCLICDNYGCSERGTISLNYQGTKAGIYYNTEVRILDENDNNLGPNQTGQICVRKGIPWSGYYKNQKTTEKIYDSVGDWYKTGDMGRFDEEGYLHLVERMDDIIQLGNCNISPSEVEEIVFEMEDVVQVCVVGVAEQVTAFVVRKSGSRLKEVDLKELVSRNMSVRLDGGVHFVDSLPMTTTGKVIRREVVKMTKSL